MDIIGGVAEWSIAMVLKTIVPQGTVSSNLTPSAMKLMAIDYGAKRVGIASTDETGLFALPRMVLNNDKSLLDKVLKFKKEQGADEIIIGESRNLDGSTNPIQKEIEKFKSELEEHGAEVVLHPEVFTTMEARQLQGQTEMTDASAAALILKSYIDSINS